MKMTHTLLVVLDEGEGHTDPEAEGCYRCRRIKKKYGGRGRRRKEKGRRIN